MVYVEKKLIFVPIYRQVFKTPVKTILVFVAGSFVVLSK